LNQLKIVFAKERKFELKIIKSCSVLVISHGIKKKSYISKNKYLNYIPADREDQ